MREPLVWPARRGPLSVNEKLELAKKLIEKRLSEGKRQSLFNIEDDDAPWPSMIASPLESFGEGRRRSPPRPIAKDTRIDDAATFNTSTTDSALLYSSNSSGKPLNVVLSEVNSTLDDVALQLQRLQQRTDTSRRSPGSDASFHVPSSVTLSSLARGESIEAHVAGDAQHKAQGWASVDAHHASPSQSPAAPSNQPSQAPFSVPAPQYDYASQPSQAPSSVQHGYPPQPAPSVQHGSSAANEYSLPTAPTNYSAAERPASCYSSAPTPLEQPPTQPSPTTSHSQPQPKQSHVAESDTATQSSQTAAVVAPHISSVPPPHPMLAEVEALLDTTRAMLASWTEMEEDELVISPLVSVSYPELPDPRTSKMFDQLFATGARPESVVDAVTNAIFWDVLDDATSSKR